MNLTIVTDLCSIGTLFAFVLVCTGVLVLQNKPGIQRGKFRIPYANAKYFIPVLFVVMLGLAFTVYKTEAKNFIYNTARVYEPTPFVTSLDDAELKSVQNQIIENQRLKNIITRNPDAEAYLSKLEPAAYHKFIQESTVSADKKYESGWHLFMHKIPMWIFIILCGVICYFSITKNLSLIPVLGLLSCLYMMCELGISNWIGFGIWLVVGLVVYFLYGYKHSKLNHKEPAESLV